MLLKERTKCKERGDHETRPTQYRKVVRVGYATQRSLVPLLAVHGRVVREKRLTRYRVVIGGRHR